ncbi:hypothetical protein Sfum_0612 [Syntrophobacter fumaroxidans MPOB]|uniref:Uncharacterized protein n=1 Tax=Syntrophobacter fumaroxidans (strain DSM 10017 / MPOB) TaxID=335543 RepID=A0LFV9_SYNFM|nr:hypothetical protein Sfum_0612 [Syntrophobacter fumaroxidans MPOB]
MSLHFYFTRTEMHRSTLKTRPKPPPETLHAAATAGGEPANELLRYDRTPNVRARSPATSPQFAHGCTILFLSKPAPHHPVGSKGESLARRPIPENSHNRGVLCNASPHNAQSCAFIEE